MSGKKTPGQLCYAASQTHGGYDGNWIPWDKLDDHYRSSCETGAHAARQPLVAEIESLKNSIEALKDLVDALRQQIQEAYGAGLNDGASRHQNRYHDMGQ